MTKIDRYKILVRYLISIGVAASQQEDKIVSAMTAQADLTKEAHEITRRAQDQVDRAQAQVDKAQSQIDRLLTMLELKFNITPATV